MPKSLTLAIQKASFLLILTKSVEPIFQIAGPILRHTVLEGTLVTAELGLLVNLLRSFGHHETVRLF